MCRIRSDLGQVKQGDTHNKTFGSQLKHQAVMHGRTIESKSHFFGTSCAFCCRYGRKKAVLGALVVEFFVCFLQMFAPIYELYALARFLIGSSTGGSFTAIFVMSTNISSRSFLISSSSFFLESTKSFLIFGIMILLSCRHGDHWTQVENGDRNLRSRLVCWRLDFCHRLISLTPITKIVQIWHVKTELQGGLNQNWPLSKVFSNPHLNPCCVILHANSIQNSPKSEDFHSVLFVRIKRNPPVFIRARRKHLQSSVDDDNVYVLKESCWSQGLLGCWVTFINSIYS